MLLIGHCAQGPEEHHPQRAGSLLGGRCSADDAAAHHLAGPGPPLGGKISAQGAVLAGIWSLAVTWRPMREGCMRAASYGG